MDFIETLFHLSPDGGNGFSELLILACVALAALALYATLRPARRHKE